VPETPLASPCRGVATSLVNTVQGLAKARGTRGEVRRFDLAVE